MTESRQLIGWAQIAAHLGISVRAAQNYEHQRQMPVRRLEGPKGRVWAVAEELAAWKQNASAEAPSIGSPGSSSGSAVKIVPTKHHRLVLWMLATGSGVALVGMVFGAIYLLRPSKIPTDWRVMGSTVFVLDQEGGEIWHHTFPDRMNVPAYDAMRRVGPNPCIFADLDGDGRTETLFTYTGGKGGPNNSKLICLNPGGKIRWEYATNRTVVDARSRVWAPPYSLNKTAVVLSKRGPPRILVSSHHYWSFPDQVASLDATGTLLSEFWHRGHLLHMEIADLDGDGYPEVLLGGVNDAAEFRQATLLVFDYRSISGASSSPTGERYFHSFEPGTEKAEIFFPRTPLSKSQEFNRVARIMLGAARVTVVVAEGISEEDGLRVIYDFDYELNLISVALSDPAKMGYRALEAKGEIHKDSELTEPERLKREVRVFRRR